MGDSARHPLAADGLIQHYLVATSALNWGLYYIYAALNLDGEI